VSQFHRLLKNVIRSDRESMAGSEQRQDEESVKINLQQIIKEEQPDKMTEPIYQDKEITLNEMISKASYLCKELLNDKHDEKMNSVHFYLEEAKKIIAVKNADSDPPKTQQRFSEVLTSRTQLNLEELIAGGRVLIRMLPPSLGQQIFEGLMTSSQPLQNVTRHLCALVLQCAYRSFMARKKHSTMLNGSNRNPSSTFY